MNDTKQKITVEIATNDSVTTKGGEIIRILCRLAFTYFGFEKKWKWKTINKTSALLHLLITASTKLSKSHDLNISLQKWVASITSQQKNKKCIPKFIAWICRCINDINHINYMRCISIMHSVSMLKFQHTRKKNHQASCEHKVLFKLHLSQKPLDRYEYGQ